ncbi:hypothetical protein CJ177_35130 [Rhodococcus sp. ACPA1]|nr:hypothetical protein CJ177_35130 [Rhodococcus sp. ACPA1]
MSPIPSARELRRRREANQTRAGDPEWTEVEDILEQQIWRQIWLTVCPDVGPMAARPKRKSSYGLGCHRHGFKEELCEIVDQIERKIDEQP